MNVKAIINLDQGNHTLCSLHSIFKRQVVKKISFVLFTLQRNYIKPNYFQNVDLNVTYTKGPSTSKS